MISRHILGWIALSLAVLPIAGSAETTAPAQWQVVYRDTLKSSRHWSEDDLFTTPNAGKVRGPFLAQQVTLSFSQLPRHGWVRARFHLLVRGTWDGSSVIWGPDLWSLSVQGGPRLIFASICNMGDWALNDLQSYPDDYTDYVTYPARTGAADDPKKLNSAAATYGGQWTSYAIDVVFPHRSARLALLLQGIYDDPEAEQAWGVRDVEVSVSTDAPTPDAAGLPQLWDALASSDPVKANGALWQMVGAGPLAIDFLAKRVEAMTNGSEPAPKTLAGDERKWAGLRMRRAGRIVRIIEGPASHDLCFRIDQLFPEY